MCFDINLNSIIKNIDHYIEKEMYMNLVIKMIANISYYRYSKDFWSYFITFKKLYTDVPRKSKNNPNILSIEHVDNVTYHLQQCYLKFLML